MKKFTLLAFAVLCALITRAQTFTVDTILNNGDKTNRINLVFMGDGYTSSQQAQFIVDVNTILDKFFLTSPLTEYKPFFNVYAVRVNSVESGAKHPNSATDCSTASPAVPVMTPNTYFGATFDYGGTHRLLYCPNTTAINNVLQTNTPWFDKALIVVNTPYYGGSGGNYSIGSVHPSSAEIMIHEFGHSFAGLADEYGGSYCTGLEKPNVTQETNPSLIKWKNWINPGMPIPTPANSNCSSVGLYNGANYCTNGWYRPKCDCKMRTLNQPLCDVCKQEFILKILQTVNLIDSYTPSNASVINMASNGSQVFNAQVLNDIPNTIKTQWKLDGNVVATNTESYTVDASTLTTGTHTLILTASDTTAMARTVLPSYTTTWNINIGSGSSVTLQAFNPVCSNASAFTLTGGSPVGGTYSGNGVSGNTFNPALAGAGTHNITYTYNSQTATQTISVTAAPILTGASTATICSGSNTTLSVSGATSYTWTPSSGLSATTGASVTSSAISNITYTITGNSGSCTATKTVAVTVNALPNVTASGSTSVCSGNSTTLTANGATTYSWTPATGLNATSGATVISTPAASITYALTGTANGCSKTINIPISVGIAPTLTGTNSASICAGASTNLSVSGATTYSWSPSTGLSATTGTSVTASPTNPITYTVTGTSNGCSNTKTIAVSVTTLPALTVSPTQSICAGNSASLTVSGATTYSWSPSTNLSSTSGSSITATPSASITYTVTGTNSGCSNTSTVAVQVTQAPTVSVTPNTMVCNGSSAILTASGAASYSWTPSTGLSNTNGASVTATPSATTTYTVTGSTGGCSNSQTVIVSVTTNPTLTGSSDQSVCSDAFTALNVSGANTYTWSPSTGLSATTGSNVTANPTASITYTVTGYVSGCTATKTIALNVTPLPTLTSSPNTSVCSGFMTNLTANGATTYTWSPSAGLNTTIGSSVNANPTNTTTYTITGTSNGCSNTTTTVVTVNQTPVLNTSTSVAVCDGSSAALDVSGASTYTWSPSTGLSATTGSSVTTSTLSNITYTVTGTQNGCNAQQVIAVSVNPIPVITATSTNPSCSQPNGGSIDITVQGSTNNTFTWSNGSTNEDLSTAPEGLYTVTVSSNGCNATYMADLVNEGCGAPVALQVTDITSSQARVNWNLIPCAASYEIRRRVFGSTVWDYFQENDSTRKFFNLLPSTTYEYQLQSWCDASQTVGSGFSQSYYFTTGMLCFAPSGISSTNITGTTVTLQWNPIVNATGYKLRYRKNGGNNPWFEFMLPDTQTSLGLTDLLNATTYKYQLRTLCDPVSGEVSNWSSSKFFTTLSQRMDETNGTDADMNIYPNPAGNYIIVEATFRTQGRYDIDFVDVTGRILQSGSDFTNNGELAHEFDITNYAAGIYYVRIVRGNEILVRKLLKQ